MNSKTKRLCETAAFIALGTLLSFVKIDMPMGGGMTLCSMLPLVVICRRHGTRWGLFAAFTYSVLQMLFGLDNVRYASNAVMAAGIVLLDYIVAYSVIGFSAVFDGRVKNGRRALILGITVTFFARFVCHFITGAWIWDALWPNEYGMAAVVYSAVYNGWYMGGELILTVLAVLGMYKPLERFLVRVE